MRLSWVAAVAALLLLLLAAVAVGPAQASSGDTDREFRRCVQRCRGQAACVPGHAEYNGLGDAYEIAGREWVLRLFGWDCLSNCRYQCMHSTESERRKAVQRPQEGELLLQQQVAPRQYYGKWPFLRFWGMQEPASVLLSILNAVPTVYYLSRASATIAPKGYFMRPWFLASTVAVCNAWIWSVCFHSRDIPWTEVMDYMSVFGLILAALCAATRRVLGPSVHPAVPPLIATFGITAFLHHVYTMVFRHFDYGYHMKYCIVLSALHSAVWYLWALTTPWSAAATNDRQSRMYKWKLCVFLTLFNCAALLELLDFPPILGILDAHALWHLGTVPLWPLWYSFVCDDARLMTNRLHAE